MLAVTSFMFGYLAMAALSSIFGYLTRTVTPVDPTLVEHEPTFAEMYGVSE